MCEDEEEVEGGKTMLSGAMSDVLKEARNEGWDCGRGAFSNQKHGLRVRLHTASKMLVRRLQTSKAWQSCS